MPCRSTPGCCCVPCCCITVSWEGEEDEGEDEEEEEHDDDDNDDDDDDTDDDDDDNDDDDDDKGSPNPPPPADPYPSQSGMETHPASRYVLAGLLGMLEGRLPLLLYSSHSFQPASFSDLTKVLAASKERAFPFAIFLSSYPSQLA